LAGLAEKPEPASQKHAQANRLAPPFWPDGIGREHGKRRRFNHETSHIYPATKRNGVLRAIPKRGRCQSISGNCPLAGWYPLGELPPSLAIQIGKRIVHRLAVGQSDITGDDFGAIFAQSIDGEHRGKPLGVADVWWQNCAWSVKTVKSSKPHTIEKIRVISGRNDVNYSFGVKDPYADIAATGTGVLKIWNSRVDEALSEYEDLRIFIMIRNMDTSNLR